MDKPDEEQQMMIAAAIVLIIIVVWQMRRKKCAGGFNLSQSIDDFEKKRDALIKGDAEV